MPGTLMPSIQFLFGRLPVLAPIILPTNINIALVPQLSLNVITEH